MRHLYKQFIPISRVLSTQVDCLISPRYVGCCNYVALNDYKKYPKLHDDGEALNFRGSYWSSGEFTGQVVMTRTEVTVATSPLLATLPKKKIFYRGGLTTFHTNKHFFKLQRNFIQDNFQGKKLSSKESNCSLPSQRWDYRLHVQVVHNPAYHFLSSGTQDYKALVLDVCNLSEHKIGCFVGAIRTMVNNVSDKYHALDQNMEKYDVENERHKPRGVNSKGGADCKVGKKFVKMQTKPQRKETRREQTTQWMAAMPTTLSKLANYRLYVLPKCDVHIRQLTSSQAFYKSIDDSELQLDYAYENSSDFADDALLRRLREETKRTWPKAEELIDEIQGKVLRFLLQTTKAYQALEIGCFTGYSALCLASGLVKGGSLVTCDIDANSMQFAKSYFEKSSHADQIIAIHQDGLEYLNSIIQTNRAEQEPFDFIFIDANKRKYRAYYDFILKHKLLHPSGLLVFDNTLFHGRVAAYSGGSSSSKERIARSLAEFNSYVARDARTRQVLLPIWDGLTLIRRA
ncbi:hypothetical protein PsorP6_004655 [Peronosclerospora sorghi]|uniref:Uncharacterized protein n=1 Tax=Peronosclerospora sorghi TaxID=230839 RepID=A0ACC0VJL4_9STRA|nr:hypothetical protein PsorP6_004655 [Peronosclerospora sorghi]